MARIFIAWELGGGLGHLSNVVTLSRQLCGQGHEVIFALNELSQLEKFSLPEGMTVVPAPASRRSPGRDFKTVCVSSILLNRGYSGVGTLSAMLRCWQGLYSLVKADLFIFDYAPTAMLAARPLTTPKVLLGADFYNLSPGHPNRQLAPWIPDAEQILRHHEARVVGVINAVSDYFGFSKLKYLGDLFATDLALLSTLPEIDDYPRDSQAVKYLSVGNPQAGLLKPHWCNNGKPKVLAYLKAANKQTKFVLEALLSAEADVMCFCAGLNQSDAETYQQAGLKLFTSPIAVSELLSEAQVIVCHAGKGMISESLRQGIPLMLLPGQLEQHRNATAVAEKKLGLMVPKHATTEQIGAILKTLSDNTIFRNNAISVAENHGYESAASMLSRGVDAIETLLSEPL